MSIVLTNNTAGSIILTLNNTTYTEENIISMPPWSSVLYEDVVVTDENSVNYNVPLIQEYMNSGVLILQEMLGVTRSELQTLSAANLVINMTTGTPKLIFNAKTANNIDNQQILASNDINGNLQCVYYKSVQGMSISYDFGASQALINNSNLLYPDEITSFAVQVYDSVNGVLNQVNRLYIGTLREGVKTFSPGVDTTYVNFSENSSFGVSDPIFKNSLIQPTVNTNNPPTGISDSTINNFTTFCPTYILAIINSPYHAGCPIFIATRSIKISVTTTIDWTTQAAPVSTVETPTVEAHLKVVFKYLHKNLYVNGSLVETPYRGTSESPLYDKWILLQESVGPVDNVSTVPVANLASIIIRNAQLPLNVLGVITEYTADGALLVLRSDDISGVSNWLYKITCSSVYDPAKVDPDDPTNTLPTISSISLPSTLNSTNATIRNISYLQEIGSDNYNIFITLSTQVWRYSSSSVSWSPFLYPNSWISSPYDGNNLSSYFDTSILNGALTSVGTGRSNLREISNFVLVPKNDTPNSYIGILGSELGVIFYNLRLVANKFVSGAKVSVVQALNVAKFAIISDIKVNIYGQNIFIFICSYSSQIPRKWLGNTNCLQLINSSSTLVQDVYYIKPDIENSESVYYVTENILNISHLPSSEQVSFSPVLIDTQHNYTALSSPKYSFKLDNFTLDTVLNTALSTYLAYKYYVPYITERIISNVSPMEKTLQLSEFKHAFTLNCPDGVGVISGLGQRIKITNRQIVSLQGVIVYDTSFLCISTDSSVVLPVSIIETDVVTLTFAASFTGVIYLQSTLDLDSVAVSVELPVIGLFSVLKHNLGKYPQVSLDSSVSSLLNDIRYVDQDSLEISFISPVNTVVNLR